MTATTAPATASGPTWGKSLAKPASEFGAAPLAIRSGALPQALRGTLYRNGPARFGRGGIPIGHWFDGDGAVLAVRFTENGATATYRFVKTEGYQAEAQAGKLLYGNYGMTAPGPIWNHWRRPIKNAANTSVLALPDRLLALWEGGSPYALDLETLETVGAVRLSEQIGELPYSAHPKRDAETGEIFNFGISLGAGSAKLNLYRSDRTGAVLQHQAIALSGVPLVHDFILAGPYLVFILPPVRLEMLPVALGFKSFSDGLAWKPELGTEILIVDRQTLAVVSRIEADPWFQWHCSNGFVDEEGNLVLDIIRYADFRSNQRLRQVATGQTHILSEGQLHRIEINPQTGKIQASQVLVDRGCEFPTVAPHQVGQQADFTYCSIHRADADPQHELYGAIAHYHHPTETLTVADCGLGRYPSEPVYVPHPDHPDRGWLLTVVFDGNTETSEVWIYDRDRLTEPPICQLELPSVIPLSFHGTWQSA